MKACMCGAAHVGGYDHPDPDIFPSGNVHGTRGCWNKDPQAALPGSRTCGIYAEPEQCEPIDLGAMRHFAKVMSDRDASRAHAEREPWHAGIDPDDP